MSTDAFTLDAPRTDTPLRGTLQPTESALRHANLKLAALRAENIAMKKNIRILMQALARLEHPAQQDEIMTKAVA